jgi:GT2 family glycosyltransferase
VADPSPRAQVLRGNDYGPIVIPRLGEWEPRLSVSVVIPAYGAQEKLDHVLASLAAQSYPRELMEVVIVDDGSSPPLRLPEIRPGHCRIVPPADGHWGSAGGTNAGAAASDGDVVLRLDADMLAWREHVESQMRWHHQADYLVVLGHKRFVDYQPGRHTPHETRAVVAAGLASELFDEADAKPQWIETVIDRTGGLKRAPWRNVANVFVGASASFHRALFERAGGFDATMALGSDTDFGHRLAQAGALFVPDDDASSWHLGVPQIKARTADGNRYRRPYFLQRLPEHRSRRQTPLAAFDSPYVDIVIDVDTIDLDRIESRVRPLLDGARSDIRITLVAPWPGRGFQRAVVADAGLEGKVVQAYYDGESRVRFATATPEPHPSTPYRLELPLAAPATAHTVARLTKAADERNAGLLEMSTPDGTVRLVRRAAAARADHLGVPIRDVATVVRLDAEPPAPEATRRHREIDRLINARDERSRQQARRDRLAWHVRRSPTWILRRIRQARR